MQGKVSMVMPCYNKEEYIGEMLDSILAQEWDNIELIFVNDGSTDRTRDIIVDYTPELAGRGYEVIIIDQANAGVCHAAKTGLARVTGDYVCMIDADDELDPRYVSAMAEWLDTHHDCEFCVCDFISYQFDQGHKEWNAYNANHSSCYEHQRSGLKNYLLGSICMSVWVYMLRVSYLRKTNVLEDYYTDTKGSHEPGYIIPVWANKTTCKHIALPLYKFRILKESHSKTADYKKIVRHWEEYERLVHMSLDNLRDGLLSDREKMLFKLCFEFTKHRRWITGYQGNDEETYGAMMEKAAQFFSRFCPPMYSSLNLLKSNCGTIISNTRKILIRKVIGYGALGMYGQRLLPSLTNFLIAPTELWDIAAGDEGSYIDGFPLYKPDFDSLMSGDIICVFTKRAEIIDEIEKAIEGKDVKIVFNEGNHILKLCWSSLLFDCGYTVI